MFRVFAISVYSLIGLALMCRFMPPLSSMLSYLAHSATPMFILYGVFLGAYSRGYFQNLFQARQSVKNEGEEQEWI